jgi:hypothetical protein
MKIFDLIAKKWIDNEIDLTEYFDKYFEDVFYLIDENDDQKSLRSILKERYENVTPIMFLNVTDWRINDNVNALNVMNNYEYYSCKDDINVLVIYRADVVFSLESNGINLLFNGKNRNFYECTNDEMLHVACDHIYNGEF